MVASTKDLATQEDNNDNNNGDQKTLLPGKRRGQKRLQPLKHGFMNLCQFALFKLSIQISLLKVNININKCLRLF